MNNNLVAAIFLIAVKAIHTDLWVAYNELEGA